MPKFIVNVEFDGYDDYEEMLNAVDENQVSEALENHGFTVNLVERFYGVED